MPVAVLVVRALAPEEAAQIERLARSRTAAARLVERAKMVQLARAGQHVPGIARALGVTEATVRLWLKRVNACGPDGLRDVCLSVSVPVVAIGGIDASNAADCIRAGAAGVAVIRAVAEIARVRAAVDAAL